MKTHMSLFEKYIFSYVVLVWGKAIRMSVSVLPVFVYVLYRHNYVSKCFETYVSNVFKFFFTIFMLRFGVEGW